MYFDQTMMVTAFNGKSNNFSNYFIKQGKVKFLSIARAYEYKEEF